jgi:hypothetical protein
MDSLSVALESGLNSAAPVSSWFANCHVTGRRGGGASGDRVDTRAERVDVRATVDAPQLLSTAPSENVQ